MVTERIKTYFTKNIYNRLELDTIGVFLVILGFILGIFFLYNGYIKKSSALVETNHIVGSGQDSE